MESIPSHKARAVLQGRVLCQQGASATAAWPGSALQDADPASRSGYSGQREGSYVVTGLWAAVASFGCRGHGRPTPNGKHGGMEGPAHRGASPHGFWGQYLSPGGESCRRLMSTVMGYHSVSMRRSVSTLWRADSVLMCSRLSWIHLIISGTWRRHS